MCDNNLILHKALVGKEVQLSELSVAGEGRYQDWQLGSGHIGGLERSTGI